MAGLCPHRGDLLLRTGRGSTRVRPLSAVTIMEPAPHASVHRASGLRGDRGADRTDPTDGPAVLRYLDVVASLRAAPVVLAFGAPTVGYALGVAAWILVRAFRYRRP